MLYSGLLVGPWEEREITVQFYNAIINFMKMKSIPRSSYDVAIRWMVQVVTTYDKLTSAQVIGLVLSH